MSPNDTLVEDALNEEQTIVKHHEWKCYPKKTRYTLDVELVHWANKQEQADTTSFQGKVQPLLARTAAS